MGGLLDRFAPRNIAVAKTIVFVLTWAASGVTIVFAAVFPDEQTAGHATLAVVASAGLIVTATAVKVLARPPRLLWALYPLAAVALIAMLDVITQDASPTAQIFFLFPVLYAGAQLRRQGAAVVCGSAVLGVAVVNVWLLPGVTAVVNIWFVGAALATTGALLAHSAERTDRLVTQLERQAALDPLTGLLTRRVLDNAASSAVGGADTDGGTALLLMDIDHFKQVNDIHGHPAGDAVLQELANLLMRLHRRGDVMSRMGGDEIAVLLPGCSLAAALMRAEEILFEVRMHTVDISAVSLAMNGAARSDLSVTLSIGVAHLPTHARDLRALYAAADAALYLAKDRGRNCVAAARVNAAESEAGTAAVA